MSLRIALISLHTSPNDDPGTGDVGGMNVAVRHTAFGLAEEGHHVEVLTRRSSQAGPAEAWIGERVLLRRLVAGPQEPRDKGEHERFIRDFSARLAELGPYDLMHAHHWFSGIAALPVAAERGIPLLQSFHSIAADPDTPLSQGERPESPGRLAGERRLGEECDAVIAVSDAERDTVLTRLGASAGRVWTVSPGVDADLFRPPADGEHPPIIGDYLVVAARLEPLKGVDLAIRTLAALPPERRPLLVVSGGATSGYEDYPARLLACAVEQEVSDSVRFIGPQGREALAALVRHARALILPSHSETFGLIALEAQASATPVVASNVGGLREAVVHGETGMLVNGRDPARWALVVAELLGDPRRAAHLGAAGRARALGFTWRRTALGTLAVYAQVGARAGAT